MLFATEQWKGPLSYLVTLLITRPPPLLMSWALAAVTSELPLYHVYTNGVPLAVQVNVTLSLNSTRFVLLTVRDTFVIFSKGENIKTRHSVLNYNSQPILNTDFIHWTLKNTKTQCIYRVFRQYLTMSIIFSLLQW